MIRKIMLFLSSYIPLYLLLIGKNIFERISKIPNFSIRTYDYKKIKFFNEFNDYMVAIFIGISIFLFIYLLILVFGTKTAKKDAYRITNISNETDKYFLNYICIYLLPCIGLSLNNIVDVYVLTALMLIIGFIYVTNDIVYINPMLGFIGFKVYTADLKSVIDDKKVKKIVICQSKAKLDLKEENSIIKLTSNGKYAVYIENSKESR